MFCFSLNILEIYMEIFNGVFIEGVLTRLESPQSLGVGGGSNGRPPHPLSHTHTHTQAQPQSGLKCSMTSLPPWPLTSCLSRWSTSPAKRLVASHLVTGRRTTLTLLFQKEEIKSWLFSSRAAKLLQMESKAYLSFVICLSSIVFVPERVPFHSDIIYKYMSLSLNCTLVFFFDSTWDVCQKAFVVRREAY